jgi:hypothetical protein
MMRRPTLISSKVHEGVAFCIVACRAVNQQRLERTERELRNAVRESNVQIYVIGIYEPLDLRDRTPEEEHGPAFWAR